ncbi:MAG: hypothetical protein ACRC1F_01470 [Metamycoplasmataceae bacterium]
MENKETRVKKWMKYREEILENQNIRESLINTNKEFQKQYNKLSTIFHNIDFIDSKNNFHSKIDSIDLNTQKRIDEINKNLETINKIERISGKKNEEKNYNCNKYDKFIKKYFAKEQQLKSDELSNIKVTKIDLGK